MGEVFIPKVGAPRAADPRVAAEASRQAAVDVARERQNAAIDASVDAPIYEGPSVDRRTGEYVPPTEAELMAAAARAERERQAAAARVEAAKAKVQAAMSPMASAQAKAELAVAEKQLSDVSGTPWWQYGLAAVAVGAIGLGVYTLVRKRR